MPRKYKKRTKRSRSKSNDQLVFRRSPLPFKFPAKLKYEEVFSIDPSVGGVAVNVFSANGIYDPNVTGSGHQPRGYDQIQALYDHYVVIGSKILVKFMGSNGNTNALTCFVAVRDSVSLESTLNNYVEGTKCFHRNIVQTTGSTEKAIIKSTFSPKRFLGRSKVMADPNLKGNASSNPSEGAFFHVGAGAVSLGVEPSAILCQVFIEYLCIFIEPKNPAQS